MRALYLKTDGDEDFERSVKLAGKIIREGGLVAFPTETVYGLGGNALDPTASMKIYAAKGRPSDNPLIVHIARMEDLKVIASEIPDNALLLAEKCWPGPLTMILKKTECVPYETTGGLDTVAVRFPSDKTASALILAAGGFVAAPSANLSGRPSPTKASHVVEDLGDRIDAIIDGGDSEIGLESTIVDFTEEVPVVLRPGYISLSDLSGILGEVRMDPGLIDENSKKAPKAPGMKYRHYAPKGNLTVVEGEKTAVVSAINELIKRAEAKNVSCAVLCAEDSAALYEGRTYSLGSRQKEGDVASALFDTLRRLDSDKIEVIYSESFYAGNIGAAVMNRLLKAAGHQVLKV